MAKEWWVDGHGTNTLKGVPGDADNPALLTDDQILYFLTHIPASRASFDRLYPTMTDEEKERLDNVARMASNGLVTGEIETAERFQRALNTKGVRRGGGPLLR